LPCIRILFTVNLDGDVRADGGAEGTPVAVGIRFQDNGMKPFGIEFTGRLEIFFFACYRTKKAFLTQFTVDLDCSLQ
jgi:hypothetical protein